MTLDELITPKTPDQVKAQLLARLSTLGMNTSLWKPGSPTRTILALVASIVSSLTELAALIAKSGFLELSEGNWLTLVARYVYGVERSAGSFASGDVQFTNTSGFLYAGSAGDLTARNPTTGKTYRNTAAFTIGAGASGTIAFEAVELGSDSTSAPGTITSLSTPLAGVTITNGLAFVGTDPEDDAALRLRCSEKVGTLSPNGTRDAYAFAARSATLNGQAVGVTRVRTFADGVGGVDLYVATASGVVTGTVGDTSTPLGAVDAAAQAMVPEGVTLRTHSATAHAIDVTCELWVRSSLTADAIVDAISLALTDWLATRPIGGHDLGAGGKVFLRAIETVIGATEGIPEVIDVAVTLPIGDVAIATTEAPTLGAVLATVHLVN
jgi:phage-related baseplate assembly protein